MQTERPYLSTIRQFHFIGIGGIETAQDALEFLMAGAVAIQVGTANFHNPRASLEVLDGLEAWMHKEGVRDIKEIVGVAARPNTAE